MEALTLERLDYLEALLAHPIRPLVLDDDLRALLAMARSSLADLWVPVSDRLPEIGTECLVWVAASPWAKAPYVGIDTWDEQREDPLGLGGPTIATGVMWNENEFDDITHWMPLPCPPKADAP